MDSTYTIESEVYDISSSVYTGQWFIANGKLWVGVATRVSHWPKSKPKTVQRFSIWRMRYVDKEIWVKDYDTMHQYIVESKFVCEDQLVDMQNCGEPYV